jgi:hypothetical protein
VRQDGNWAVRKDALGPAAVSDTQWLEVVWSPENLEDEDIMEISGCKWDNKLGEEMQYLVGWNYTTMCGSSK